MGAGVMTVRWRNSGSVVATDDGRWQAVITLPAGSRVKMKPFPDGTPQARAESDAANMLRTAHHEAGHAVVGHVLGQNVESATVLGDDQNAGQVRIRAFATIYARMMWEHDRVGSLGQVNTAMRTHLAGYAAESVHFGVPRSLHGAYVRAQLQWWRPDEDITRALRIARSYFLAERIGEWRHEQVMVERRDAPVTRPAERAARKMMRAAWDRTVAYLETEEGRRMVQRLATVLIKETTIDRDRVMDVARYEYQTVTDTLRSGLSPIAVAE